MLSRGGSGTSLVVRGAYVDAKTSVRWDPNAADREGWLMKKSRWMGDWRERFFILKGSKLFFAKDEEAAPHGMIDLVDCISAKDAQDRAKRPHCLEIVLRDERFYLSAESEDNKTSWLSAILKCIQKHSSIYHQEAP